MFALFALLSVTRAVDCTQKSDCASSGEYCNYDTVTDQVDYELEGSCAACPSTACSDGTYTQYQAGYLCEIECENQPDTDAAGGCHDLDILTYDSRGGYISCKYYDPTQAYFEINECGAFDDTDFDAVKLCCACGGGTALYEEGTCIDSDNIPNYDNFCSSEFTGLCVDDTGSWSCVNEDHFWVEIDCKTCDSGSLKGGAIAVIILIILCCCCVFVVAPIMCCCGACAVCQASKGADAGGNVNSGGVGDSGLSV